MRNIWFGQKMQELLLWGRTGSHRKNEPALAKRVLCTIMVFLIVWPTNLARCEVPE